ncbi:DNA gyrase subunit A [Candidatus Wolfebacteria bacterium]|nr:DNA gyrase subunit A [Candidatus Wolfebacteria bacterium]
MADKEEKEKKVVSNIIDQDIVDEMRTAYIDYAMTVITSRALPDVRDGLKPVHRRILFGMKEMGLTPSARFRKSAAVVGDVLGKYHPHGDTSVYDAMAKLAQNFATRYPLVQGQGNFGSVDGDSPAAMRYTEAKMSKISEDILRDLDKDTVEWRPNYDATKKEPTVLPTIAPNLLLNGTLGIAVGMATNIPPHNLREVVDAIVHLIDNPKATTEDLLGFVKGPDFPLGGVAFNQKDIVHAYTHGRGGVVVRGEAEIIEDKKGFAIIISSIPFRVNKSDLIVKMADLARDKRIEGIRDIRDESTSDIRIVIELKGTAQPQTVLNSIYKFTQLEDTFHYNMVALVEGVPQTLSLKEMLEAFVGHRKTVVRRRTQFDLNKAEEREHILLGLKKALDHIDEIIKIIRASKDVPTAHAGLMKKFKFSDRQATAILEMRLAKLAGLERKKIEEELSEIQKIIVNLKSILASAKKIQTVIKKELAELHEKHGDDRRTKIMKGGVKNISVEDLVPEEDSMLVLTKGGYIKRTNPKEYKKQKRGGVGVIDLSTKEEDVVDTFITASTHSDLLFFTDAGKAYQVKMYEIPEGRRATKGKSIANFLALTGEENVTNVLAVPKGAALDAMGLVFVTKHGTVKKVSAKSFAGVRRSGIIAINLKDKDCLISAHFVSEGDDIMIVTSNGQAIRFRESDAREMGRTAAGVRGIKLTKDDRVVSAHIIPVGREKEAELLVVSEMGYGKHTKINEYKQQKRAGSGIKTASITSKTGKIVGGRMLLGDLAQYELVAVSKKGQVIRTGVPEIPSQGRSTQGVRIMKLRAGDAVASIVLLTVEE